MKKILFLAMMLVGFGLGKAQNVQMHYDFGKDRQMITTTIEMFRPDKWGSTFFFSDLDYGSKASGVDGISLAYWEIARSFKVSANSAFEPRIEYNGGFGRGEFSVGETVNQYHYSINSAFLAGGQYTWNNEDFSRVFTLQANYKYIKDVHDASFQLTAVWGLHFLDRKVSFTGFADFWREEQLLENENTDFVFLAEPQLWYNATQNFSIGTEIEVGSNFGGSKGVVVNPTIGAKWTF